MALYARPTLSSIVAWTPGWSASSASMRFGALIEQIARHHRIPSRLVGGRRLKDGVEKLGFSLGSDASRDWLCAPECPSQC